MEVLYPAYTLPDYDTPMPNPFGVIKKIPRKLISGVIRLMKLDRIIMEIFMVMLSIPDEKLNDFLVVKLTNILKRAEKPLKEIAEKIGHDVLEPIFKAIPGLNLLYIINDIQRAQKVVAEAQVPALDVAKDIIKEARELTSDVAGPARGLSSLILGLSEYLEKVKQGGDINDVYKVFDEMGTDVNGPVSGDSSKRMAARLLASKMVHDVATEMKEAEKDGIPMDSSELMKRYKEKLDAIISKETRNYLLGDNDEGFLDLLLKILGGETSERGERGEISERGERGEISVRGERGERGEISVRGERDNGSRPVLVQSGGTRKKRQNKSQNKTRRNK